MSRYLIALPLMLALASCKQEGGKGVVLPAKMEQYIPGDTVVLIGARIDEIQTSQIFQKLAAEQQIPELNDFTKRTGLDPRKDLNELVLASNGKDAVMIARGRMENRAQLEAMLEKEGAKRTAFEKHTLIGTDDAAVVFIDNTIAVAGRPAMLKSVLTGKVDDNNKRAILERVAALPQDRPVWAVAIGGFSPMPLPETGNLANLGRIFQSLRTVSMTIDLKDGLSLAANGLCGNEKDAKQLHDMLRGLIGFGRLSTPTDKPELLRFFDGIKVDHADSTVKLNADVPMDMVEFFLSLTGKRKPAA